MSTAQLNCMMMTNDGQSPRRRPQTLSLHAQEAPHLVCRSTWAELRCSRGPAGRSQDVVGEAQRCQSACRPARLAIHHSLPCLDLGHQPHAVHGVSFTQPPQCRWRSGWQPQQC